MLAYVGPILAHVGPVLALCWPMLALAYVGPILALSWPYVGLCWPILGPMLGPCWRYPRASMLKDLQDANFSVPDLSVEAKTTQQPLFCAFAKKKMASAKATKHRK